MRSNIFVLATIVLASPSLAWYKSESDSPCKTHKTHTVQPSGPETVVTPPSYSPPPGTYPPYPISSAQGSITSQAPPPVGTGGGYSTLVVQPTPPPYQSSPLPAPEPTSEGAGADTSRDSVVPYPTTAAQGDTTSAAAGYPTTAAEGGATSALVPPVGGYNTTSKAAASPTNTAGGIAPISGAGMNRAGVGSLLLGVIGLGFAFL